MIDPKKQPLYVTVKFAYDADVFEGDPDDAYDIARLENGEIEIPLQDAIEEVVGTTRFFSVSVKPD